MKTHHPPSHWIMVALVLAAFLFTLSVAHGQATGDPALRMDIASARGTA